MKPLLHLINYKSEINKAISSENLWYCFLWLSGNSLSFLHGSRTFSAIESVPILRAFPKRGPLKALRWRLIMRPAKDWAPVTEPFPRASSSLDVQAGLHCAKRWVHHPFTPSTTLIYSINVLIYFAHVTLQLKSLQLVLVCDILVLWGTHLFRVWCFYTQF